MYEDILADNVNLCQIRASIFDAPYFWYNDDTKNCKLISSSERQCDQIIGTPTPEYEPVYCGDEIPKRYLLVMSPSRAEDFHLLVNNQLNSLSNSTHHCGRN